MRTIATLQEADTGSARLNGINVLKQKDEVRKLLGYLPQEFGVYPRISAQDMLEHLALLKGIGGSRERKELVAAMLKRCNLYEERNLSPVYDTKKVTLASTPDRTHIPVR